MLQFEHGAVQWLAADVVNTTYNMVTSFSPKAIRLYWVGLQSNSPTAANSQAVSERRGVGFINISGLSAASVGTFSADNSGNADCGSVYSGTFPVITVDGTGTVDGILDYQISAGQVALRVQDQGIANITVFWEAWGGDEITDVTVGSIAEPAATGTQTYTATGFVASPGLAQDQCVMFAGVQSVNASGVGQAQDSGLHVGFATSTATANNVTLCGNQDDGTATMDTDGYNYTGECVSMIIIAGGNPNARATLSAFGTDTFTLNWLARATTNRRSIYMAIKGGHWVAGSTTIAGNTLNSTTTLSGLPFNVKGISLIGAMKTISTVATSTVQDRMGFGSGRTIASRNSAAVWDVDNIATSNINTSVNYTQVLVFPTNAGALATAYDISAIGANQITLITDTAGGVANEWIGYLVFGDKKTTAGTIGHPFIF